MNFLKKIISFYINSSIHVALAVCAFAMITAKEFDFENSISMLGFIFFGTITGYSFIKYVAIFAFPYQLAKSNHRFLQSVIVLMAIITFFCLLQLSFRVQMITILLGVLTLLYAIPFLKNKSLRHFNGLKIFIVALVWTGVTAVIPYINNYSEISDDFIISAFQRLMMVLVLILPFEIRDLSVDASYLRTLPQRVGVLPTKGLGILLIGICFLLEYLKDDINIYVMFSFGIILIILLVLLLFSQKKQSKYYASFWVESIPIVWWGMLLIFERFI